MASGKRPDDPLPFVSFLDMNRQTYIAVFMDITARIIRHENPGVCILFLPSLNSSSFRFATDLPSVRSDSSLYNLLALTPLVSSS